MTRTAHRLALSVMLAASVFAGTAAAKEAPPPALKEVASPGAAKDAAAAFRTDTVDVEVSPQGMPGDKIEYMIRMKAGQVLAYNWEAQGAEGFWHEFHGHTADTVTFYKKAAGGQHAGTLTAPFDGVHGWYFENRTAKPVIIRLRMGGFYELAPEAAD